MPPVVAAIVTVVASAVTAVGISGVAAAYVTAIVSTFIVAAGTGLVMWGVGTLLSAAGSALGPGGGGTQLSAIVNPIAPWNVMYGRGRIGGTVVYRGSFGDNDKYLDLVIVLAAHPCESVDWLLFDGNKVQIGNVQSTTHGWAGSSFTPLQQTIPITSASDISRSNNVVTVTLHQDIPLLDVGDQVIISGVHPVNLLLNGKFPITRVVHTPGSPGSVTFSYLAGGPSFSAGDITESGQVKTAWADYKSKVYMEVMLGTQSVGETFDGMLNGTPYDGDWGNLQTNPENPWTSDCSLVGKTAVFLRLHYNDAVFGPGLPQISFLVHGKNNILDPRISPTARQYTENAVLCIADYLSDTTWGYKAAYGTEIPLVDLIAQANICDEAVALATPATSPATTEPRYTCNGGFLLSAKRSEILSNLLTSCAGRLTYIGGQFKIWPGAWLGSSASITGTQIYSLLTGPFQWKPSTSVMNLFNGVKGTYISPFDNWQPADFPRYAQDTYHGYTWGLAPQHDANLDADGGERRWLDVQLPFTISPSMAQRIAKIELLRRRHQGSGTFPFNLAAYQFVPMDILSVDLSFFGWSGKYLEVLNFRLKISEDADVNGKVPVLTTEVDVQETDPSIYAWSIGEELSPQGYQQAIVPDNRTPAAPTNFFADSADGKIYLTWTAPADAFVTHGGHVEVEYQLVASPPGLWISLGKMDPTVEQTTIEGLTVGSQYNVQIRSVNAAGVPSEWVVATPLLSSPPTPGPITVLPPVIWDPNYETPIGGDPLFSAKSFGVAQSYNSSGDGSPLATLNVYGYPPDANTDLVFKVRRELVSGIFAQVAASVTHVSPPDGVHGVIAFGGSGGTTNQFVGRIISKLANAITNTGARVPIQDFTITANDTNGNFTVTPDPAAAGCAAGDLFTLRTAPTAADATSVTDALWNNLYNPGLTVNGNIGNLALVIGGKGAGQPPQTVVANTGTKVTVSPGWGVVPDSTSVIVLVEAVPQVVVTPDLTAVANALIGSIPIDNYSRKVVRVEGYTSRGLTGPIETVPFREIYIWGAQGSRLVTASGNQLPTDGTVLFDTSGISGTTDTLSAAITDTTSTSISLTSGAGTVNGTYIQIGSEKMYITAGGGTNSLTVQRGALGTTAATHANGATVNVPGALVFNLLPVSQITEQGFVFTKISSDINYVDLKASLGDTFPGGGTDILLPDNTAGNGTVPLKAPGA